MHLAAPRCWQHWKKNRTSRMDKDDCLFVENGKTFIFDKKKTWKPEIEEGLKPDHTGQLLAALLAGTAAGILLFMTKRKR